MQALNNREICRVVSGFMPVGKMHIGNGAVLELLLYFNKLGAEIVIPISDIEAVVNRGLTREEAKKIAIEEYILNFVARGVNLDTIEIYSQWQKGDIKNLALELGEKMKMKKINSALGLSMHNNISNIFFLLFK